MKNLIDIKRILKAIVNALHALKLLIDDIPVPGGAGGVDYSTTETDTGIKWIDGSSIYQIVIPFETPFEVPAGSTGKNVTDDRFAVIDQPLEAFCIGLTSLNYKMCSSICIDKKSSTEMWLGSTGGVNKLTHLVVNYLKTSE